MTRDNISNIHNILNSLHQRGLKLPTTRPVYKMAKIGCSVSRVMRHQRG